MMSQDFTSCEVCPKCLAFDSSTVLNTRLHRSGRLRRRKCLKCECRWSTIEVSVAQYSSLRAVSAAMIAFEQSMEEARDVLRMPAIGPYLGGDDET